MTDFQKHYSHAIYAPRPRDVKWKPSTEAMMWKTNFDGAMFLESDQAGIGVVVRNQAGQVMAALLERIQNPIQLKYWRRWQRGGQSNLLWSWDLSSQCSKVIRKLSLRLLIMKFFCCLVLVIL